MSEEEDIRKRVKESIPEFKIKRVKELPKPKRALRYSVYDKLVEAILKEEKGIFEIEVEGKTVKQMYPALSKRITERKLPLKLRVRSGTLYIEKLE